jgi:hypothetical protein
VKRFRKKLFGAFLALAAFGAAASSADASGFLSGFTGSVDMIVPSGPLDQGWVSYTVYNNTAGNSSGLSGLATALGTTTANLLADGINGNAKYVYLYQVVNTGSEFLSFLQVKGVAVSTVTSGGVINGSVFETAGGTKVTGTSNGGADMLSVTPSGNTPNFSTATQGETATFAPNAHNQFYQYNFPDGLARAGAMQYSYLLFATSNNVPTFTSGDVHDGNQSNGLVPGPSAPEPTSMAIMGLGVFGLGGWAGWRRRFRKLS